MVLAISTKKMMVVVKWQAGCRVTPHDVAAPACDPGPFSCSPAPLSPPLPPPPYCRPGGHLQTTLAHSAPRALHNWITALSIKRLSLKYKVWRKTSALLILLSDSAIWHSDACGYCWSVSFDFEMMYFDLVGLVLVKSGERTAGPSNVNGQKKLGKKEHLGEVAWLSWACSWPRQFKVRAEQVKKQKYVWNLIQYSLFEDSDGNV